MTKDNFINYLRQSLIQQFAIVKTINNSIIKKWEN
jgi:hypothetical protein